MFDMVVLSDGICEVLNFGNVCILGWLLGLFLR